MTTSSNRYFFFLFIATYKYYSYMWDWSSTLKIHRAKHRCVRPTAVQQPRHCCHLFFIASPCIRKFTDVNVRHPRTVESPSRNIFFPHRTGSHWGWLEENKSKKIKKIKSTSRFHQNRRSGNKSGIIKSRNLNLAGRNWQVGRRSRRGGGNTKMWTLPRLVYHVLLTRLTINQIALCGLQERRKKNKKTNLTAFFFSTRT